MIENLNEYKSSQELMRWGMEKFGINKPKDALTDDEIRRVIRWVAVRAYDTILIEGKPIMGRGGIDLMLTLTLLEFPEYYMRYELSQFN